MRPNLIPAFAAITLVLLLALVSCGGSGTVAGLGESVLQQDTGSPASQTGFPTSLPTDGVQPWETMDSNGFVVPQDKGASSITFDAEYMTGVDTFMEGGSTASIDGILTVDSGNAGSGDTSYAIYRFVLGGQDPGALGVDINLRNQSDSSTSSYYLGLADYSADSWEWHGPFTDGQVRLAMNGGMLSNLGNAFVAVVAHDGADLDVVGMGIDVADAGDTTAPDVPVAPTVTAVDGGLMLEWLPVSASDMAGYKVYWSNSTFIDLFSTGVHSVDYIEGNTRHLLAGVSGKTYVRIASVDVSGNVSDLSDVASGTPLAGTAPGLEVTVDKAVGLIGDSFEITASGASSYDFDLDGDGVFELTGEGSGTQVWNVDSVGIIRPAVRGSSGTAVALGAVSLSVGGNARPVARLYADPAVGVTPFSVSFTSEGEDFDGSIDEYAWDFNGDGIYDEMSASPALTPKTYSQSGLFNAKLRVTDDKGASDVDTVAILARRIIGFESRLVDFDPYSENNYVTAIVDGNPAVLYFDSELPSLQYRRALDADGLVWAPPVDLTTVPDIGDFPGMAVINGRPAAAWWAPASNEIKYLIADDAQGTSWSGTPVVVGPSPQGVGFRISMTTVDGNPALAWYNGGNLNYRRATSSTGATIGEWADPVAVIDNTGFVGGPPKLAVINNNPAVAYYRGDTGHIYFKRAITTSGALVGDWPALATDCTPAGFAPNFRVNMLEVNGNPAISFPDNSTQSMAYMRALDADGVSWPAGAVQVNTGNFSTPNFSDMKIVRGRPAIAYQTFWPTTSVWYTRAQDANGSSWSEEVPMAYDWSVSQGEWLNLLVNNGLPYGIYRNDNSSGINIAVPRYE